jgi:hypothetical protein
MNLDEHRATLLTFVGTLAAFKLVTSVMILYFAPTLHALSLVLILSFPWLLAGGLWGAHLARSRRRLYRARARRRELLSSEWRAD